MVCKIKYYGEADVFTWWLLGLPKKEVAIT